MLGFICGKWFWYTLRRVVKEEFFWGRVGLELVPIPVEQPSQNLSHGEISYPYPHWPIGPQLIVYELSPFILSFWGFEVSSRHIFIFEVC